MCVPKLNLLIIIVFNNLVKFWQELVVPIWQAGKWYV